MKKETVTAQNAPAAVGPYSHGVKAGGFLYTSGQLGVDVATGKLAEGIEEQTRCCFSNLQAVLEAGGGSLDTIVKIMVFIKNMDDFSVLNRIYAEYFSGGFPSRSCVEVAKLPLGGLVEIEAVAYIGG